MQDILIKGLTDGAEDEKQSIGDHLQLYRDLLTFLANADPFLVSIPW